MKRKIMNATIKAYNKKGLKFTMEDVSKEIDISKKTIYKYYKNKEELVKYIISETFNEVHLRQKEISLNSKLGVKDKLIEILNASNELINSINLTNLEEFLDIYPDLYVLIMAKYENNWQTVIDLIEAGHKRGIFNTEYSSQMIRNLLSEGMKSLHMNNVLKASNIDYRTGITQVINIIIKGITK